MSSVEKSANVFVEPGRVSDPKPEADDKEKQLLRELNRDRPVIPDRDLDVVSKDHLVSVYLGLQKYIDGLQRKYISDLQVSKENEEKIKTQLADANRKENVLVMRLTMKEHELQEYVTQLNELKNMMIPNTSSLRSTLVDPAVNILMQKLRKELEDTKKKLEDTQNDLNAWKFTPDSNTGKRLMAKCRMLYQENEELGKVISSGRLAKLETDLALQKSLTEEMRKAQAEMDEVIQELDEDIDGMQSTICFWQDQLKKHQIKKADLDAAKAEAAAASNVNNRPHHHHRSSKSPSPMKSPKNNEQQEQVSMEVDNINVQIKQERVDSVEAPAASVQSPPPAERAPQPPFDEDSSSSDRELQIDEETAPETRSIDGIKEEPKDIVGSPPDAAARANTSSSMDGISDGDEDM